MRVMTIHWLSVVALVCCIAGCETTGTGNADDPNAGYSNRWSANDRQGKTGLLIEPNPAAEIGYRIGWASPIELFRGQRITSVTALGDIVVVVEDPKNVVTALRADNGRLLWKVNLGSELEELYAPSRDGDEVYIHSGARFFTLSAGKGEVLAVAKLETTVGSAAVYAPENRLAIMSGSNGLVFAHSVDSNFTRWRYTLANRISNSSILAGQDVFVVDTGGTYAMLETQSGRPLWRNHTLGPVTTAPAVQGSEVIVASRDGKLYALNRTTGRDTWTYLDAEQPLSASPVALGRLIIQPLLPNKGMIAVDAITGEEVWRADVTATPVIIRQKDMLLSTDNSLIALDLGDGEVRTEAQTLPIMSVIPVGDDGSVILVSAEGRLLRLTPN